MEHRLFAEGAVPEFTTFEFFARQDWIPPEVQVGHRERQVMVGELVESLPRPDTITDLGAGDGELIALLSEITTARAWGYDAGEANRARAAELGRDVRPGNIVDDLALFELGDMVVCTEVVEHLLDPHGWLRHLAAIIDVNVVVLSSPSTETPEQHYEHHAWCWDLDGYAALIRGAGFAVIEQRECEAGFQAVAAKAA